MLNADRQRICLRRGAEGKPTMSMRARSAAFAASVLAMGLAISAAATATPASASTRAHAAPAALTWSAPQATGASYKPTSVSCPSATFCAATDQYGQVLTFNGTSWSAPVTISSPFDPQDDIFGAVSCTSATFCVAVDQYGGVTYYNGQTWTAVQTIQLGGGLGGVSCTSPTFCVAVDSPAGGYDALTLLEALAG